MRQWRRWSWHGDNQAELLVDGECFFPAMLSAVQQAQHYVLMEFYFVSSGQLLNRFIEVLSHACRRGVKVYLLVDAVGGRDLKEIDRQRITSAGVQLIFYNPLSLWHWNRNFRRDHRKLLVIDGAEAYIGGTGLTDDFWQGQHHQPPWHEVMVKVEGNVITDWEKLFVSQWQRSSGQPLALPKVEPGQVHDTIPMRVAITQGIHQQGIKANFRRQVRAAHQRVWLVTAYFLPSASVQRALVQAAIRGVEVGVLVPAGSKTDHPGLYYASRRYYRRLLEAGVQIYEYQPRFIHAKLAVCDDWLSIGSCNLDHWNLRWNLEANQELVSAELAEQVLQLIADDCQQSEQITLEAWLNRPWTQRLRDYCWGYLNSWLLKIV